VSKRALNLPQKIARNHPSWLPALSVFLAAVAVIWLYSFAVPRRDKPLPLQAVSSGKSHKTAPQSLSDTTEFGQFAPATDAERELEKMLRGKDEDIDLVLANWLIAADIPQFADMTREAYFAQLDAMTKQVRMEMARMQKVAEGRGQNPGDPDVRCAIFCNAVIKLRFGYREEFRGHDVAPARLKALYSDANNIFLAGLLRTRRGSCVSMPLVYLVIGRRFGFPVYLVAVGKHYFIRWEEPGYRMNIETTQVDKVWVTDDDLAYVEEEGLTPEQVSGSELRSLTNREVIGTLFFARQGHLTTRNETQACMDLSRARHLAPDDPAIKATHEAVFTYYGIKPEHRSIESRVRPKA
jgi:hypothetical protein